MVLTYPNKLKEHWKVKMILDYLNHPYGCSGDYDVVFNSSTEEKHVFNLETNKRVINGRCNSVLKDNVDRMWKEVSGCGLTIDPLKHRGWCVEKTLKQGTNSGKLIKCPSSPRKGMGYFRWVDTRDGSGNINDYRVVICNGKIILCLLKSRDQSNIFNFPEYKFKDVGINHFSTHEIYDILTFSAKIGLDFGEIDVLRSNFDGRIYVVDVNNLAGYGYFREAKYLKLVSNEFKKAFL